MGELVDRDQEHLRLVKLGFYIMAGVGGLISLFSLVYIGLGGMLASGAIPIGNGRHDEARTTALLLGGIGIAVLLIGLTVTFLAYLAGRSIGIRRRRNFCIIIAGLCCLQIPWGTAIGVCSPRRGIRSATKVPG